MRKKQSLEKILADKKANVKKCLELLKISQTRINKQQSGCIIPDYGSAYTYKGKRCAIGILVTAKDIRWNTYGVIENDEQAYLVSTICKRYSMPYMGIERSFTKTFLQKLQDAHDDAFDMNSKILDKEKMALFNQKCEEIKEWLYKHL
jgi:hypothetical protein